MDHHEQSEEAIATEDEAVAAGGGELSDQEALEASSEDSERRWHRLHQDDSDWEFSSSSASITGDEHQMGRQGWRLLHL